MYAHGSGGAVGAGGGWYTTGAGGGAGGATYQECGENSEPAVVSLTMRSDMRNDAFTIGGRRPAGAAFAACVPGSADGPRTASTVCDVSGIRTIQPAHASAAPIRTLVRSVTLPSTTHL